ncbi:hypothetical protein L7F22_034701 [Adiantum nelumboides]|nr:hypothetical protein [Adiantum nelumboides]
MQGQVLPDSAHNPNDPPDNMDPTSSKHQISEGIVIREEDLTAWHNQLNERVVLGLCHGPRPSMEVLKQWIAFNWENRNVFPQHIQYLPNNYYLFFFEDANSALQDITEGQWLIKNTPNSFFKWHKGFNPRGEKPTRVPVWVDFPDLPMEFYPWLGKLDNSVVKIAKQEAKLPHGEPIQPNIQEFQAVKKSSYKPLKKKQQQFNLKRNFFGVLLEEVFDPLNVPSEDAKVSADFVDRQGSYSNTAVKASKDGKLHNQEDQSSCSSQMSPSTQVPPTSPLDKTRGLSDSESEEELIDSTQMQEVEEDILQFTKELNAKDVAAKELLASSPVPSTAIQMSQGEEESLPNLIAPKSKRKVEKSTDPNRASVALAKPQKNSKK